MVTSVKNSNMKVLIQTVHGQKQDLDGSRNLVFVQVINACVVNYELQVVLKLFFKRIWIVFTSSYSAIALCSANDHYEEIKVHATPVCTTHHSLAPKLSGQCHSSLST